nr:hypothetical protein [Porphyromonas gulae]
MARKSFSFGSRKEKISTQNEKIHAPLLTKTRTAIAAFTVPKSLRANL